MSEQQREAYAARMPGWPGFCAVAIDRGDAETAKCLSDWVKRGLIVERVTRDDGVAGLDEWSAEKKRRATPDPPEPLSLFARATTAQAETGGAT